MFTSSEERWACVKGLKEKELPASVSNANGTGDCLTAYQAKGLVDEVMCTFVYPRLDVNVSIGVSQWNLSSCSSYYQQINHLLKSPFVVHPKTGAAYVTNSCNTL